MHNQPQQFGGYDPDQDIRNRIDSLYAKYDMDNTGTLGPQ